MSEFHKDGLVLAGKFIMIAICGACIQAYRYIGVGLFWQSPFIIAFSILVGSSLKQIYNFFKNNRKNRNLLG